MLLRHRKYRGYFAAAIFLAPAIIGLLAFRAYPVFLAVWESLFTATYGGGGAGKSFVGFENYQFLWEDFIFWRSVKATAILTIFINPIQITLALALALLLQRASRLIGAIRTLFLLPVGVALPIATIVWGLMLNPNQGLVNSFLDLFGIPPQPFLTSEAQAIWCIILIASWKGVALWMLFLLAGLQDIPKTFYEAARIDGAKLWHQIRFITLPLLKRSLLFVTVADTTINFVLFVPMFLLTQGGPRNSTNVLMFEAYRSGFAFQDFGRSMAIVTILTIVILIVIGIQIRLLRAKH
ncbi:MAG: sugar ABC transporter permease [Rhodospirillales bacterium]|nr:sugar ABC transporter permease [Rhodospirillales bacterium]